MSKRLRENSDYTEYLTITGNTQKTIFPNVYTEDNHTWGNPKILINEALVTSSTYIESLIITPVTAGTSNYVDVTLGVTKTTESEAGVETTNTYNIINDARIHTTTSLVFEKEDLSVFDPKVFSLFVQSSHTNDVITVLFKIKNVRTSKLLADRKNRSLLKENLINHNTERTKNTYEYNK